MEEVMPCSLPTIPYTQDILTNWRGKGVCQAHSQFACHSNVEVENGNRCRRPKLDIKLSLDTISHPRRFTKDTGFIHLIALAD